VYKRAFFGYFEGVQKKRFGKEYCGRFRIAHGPSQPFPLWAEYQGLEPFSDYQPFLVDIERNEALCLEPLAYWDTCELHRGAEEPHFFLLDRQVGDDFEFKAVGYDCSIRVDQGSKYRELVDELLDWKQSDPVLTKANVGTIRPPEELSEGD
jgi:hypothetical protein